MLRLVTAIAMFLPLVQGCSIADKPYHPVCSDATCSPQAMQDAVSTRTDLAIQRDGWGACLDDPNHSKLDHSALAQRSRCENFDRATLLPVPYAQAWLEYREDGHQHDPVQRDAILRWIGAESGPIYVVVYIHGWHHNADPSNGDPRNNAIKFPFLMARQVDVLKRMALDRRAPMPQVLGIYIGWRGEEYTDPLRRLLSIDGRSEAADTIGHAGVLKHDLQDIASAMRARDAQASRMVVFGHSLGGRMTTSMFKSDLDNGQPQPLGSDTLIVTLNAAVGADCFDGVFQAGGKNPDTPRPTWINITSENDTATNEIYATAKDVDLVHGCNPGSPASGKTIGHYRPYFRQVIDQASVPLPADATDADAQKNAAAWEPAWYKQAGKRLFMKFPYRTDAAFDPSHAMYTSVNVGIENPELPSRVLDRGVWNVRSDKSLMDFDVSGDNLSGHHNGIISTTLIRLLTEVLYPPAQ